MCYFALLMSGSGCETWVVQVPKVVSTGMAMELTLVDLQLVATWLLLSICSVTTTEKWGKKRFNH